MSRANGTIKFKDGHEMYCLYCGTNDRMFSSCYPTPDIAWEMYYVRCFDRHDEYCDQELEDVTVTTDYGSGDSWNGKACRKCMTFEGPFEPEWDRE